MPYFSYIPDVRVRVSSFRQNNVEPFVAAKNIFRRVKIRESIQDDVLGFEQYSVGNNERPDQVAYDKYSDSGLDWVILLCNNVINLYQDWPLSEQELYDMVERKYLSVNGVHHYETNEVRDDLGNIVLKEGKIVNSDFVAYKPDGTVVADSVYPVSNWEYERNLNDEKSNIWLLNPLYVTAFVEEFEELLEYAPNEELGDGEQIKVSPNTVEEIFITKKKYYTTEYGLTSSIEFSGQQDLGNRDVTTTTNEAGATVTTSTSTTSAGVGVVNSSGVIAGTTDSGSTTSSTTTSGQATGGSSSGSSGY